MRSYNKIMSFAIVSSVFFSLFAFVLVSLCLGGLTEKNRGASHDEPLENFKKLEKIINDETSS